MLSIPFELVEQLRRGYSEAQRLLAFWGPVTGAPDLVAPFVALASVLALAILTGLAVGSLAALIVALLALHVLLTEVFGLHVEVLAPA
jgi:hypothetical protein